MLLRKRPDTVSVGRIKMYLQHENLLLFSRQYRLNVFGKDKVMARLDDSVLQAALVGYAAELEKITRESQRSNINSVGVPLVRRLPLAVLGRSQRAAFRLRDANISPPLKGNGGRRTTQSGAYLQKGLPQNARCQQDGEQH
jgi:hypothetical protein